MPLHHPYRAYASAILGPAAWCIIIDERRRAGAQAMIVSSCVSAGAEAMIVLPCVSSGAEAMVVLTCLSCVRRSFGRIIMCQRWCKNCGRVIMCQCRCDPLHLVQKRISHWSPVSITAAAYIGCTGPGRAEGPVHTTRIRPNP